MLLEESRRRINIQTCSQHYIRCFVEKVLVRSLSIQGFEERNNRCTCPRTCLKPLTRSAGRVRKKSGTMAPLQSVYVAQSVLLEHFRSTSFGHYNKPHTMRSTSWACPPLDEMIMSSHWSLLTLYFRSFPIYAPPVLLT